MNKRILPIFIVLIFLALVSSLNPDLTRNILFKSKLSTVSFNVALKWLHNSQFAGIYVAKEKRFDSSFGLTLNPVEFSGSKSELDMLIDGEADMAVTTPLGMLKAIEDGNDLVAVAVIYRQSPFAFVSLADSGITTPAQFSRKRIGNRGNNLESTFNLLMLVGNEKLKDVNEVTTSVERSELQSLIWSEVDVMGLYRTDQLYEFHQADVDFNIIFPEEYIEPVYGDVLVVRREFLEKNPDFVQAGVSSILNGWNYALANSQEASNFAAEYATTELYQDLTYEEFILNESIPLIADESVHVGLMQASDWQIIIDHMKNSQILFEVLDPNNVFTNEFVESYYAN